MGITKQYLRINPGPVFGVIGSATANAQFVTLKNTKTRYAVSAACENVILWDTKTGNKILSFCGEKHEVTLVRVSPDREHIAVGYTDGVIRIFNLFTTECEITFSGHKSAVTCLNYDSKGMMLASGSKDTEVVVWDIVSQAGMFRLRGHKGVVTQIRFLQERKYLVTSSKDTFIKFWDLDMQHCFKTLTGHRSEVWDFVIVNNDKRLMTGSADSEIRAWDLVYGDDEDDEGDEIQSKKFKLENEDEENFIKCVKVGSIMRREKDRVVSLGVDVSGRILSCHGNNSVLEVFLLRSDKEIEKKVQKRLKKMKKKTDTIAESVVEMDDGSSGATFADQIKRLSIVKAKGKLRSLDLVIENDIAKFLTLLHNNTLEVYSLEFNVEKSEGNCLSSLIHPGHRTDVRTVAFSSDNIAVLTASAENVKIWNRASQQCIRTMPCDYALCSAFLPGDRHCIVGTKSGKLQVFDISSGDLLEEIEAHQGAVWSICLASDQRGFVTGSADKEVKFWEYELISDENFSQTCKRLTAVHVRTLQVPEEVLCVKLSPNGRLIAVSLLDSTVKIFFVDSLKFFLSLYGHKLPVLSLDISSDSSLIVTGSADKNVKIWGLDFGDCHKSIFSHDDSIMSVQFIPKTHFFVTAGKDNMIKQWDADNFQKIITLSGHHGAVWAVAVSPDGRNIVSSSHDKSIRLWEKSDEPLILEEEQQLEREADDEKAVAANESVIPGETDPETGLAGKKTIETVKSAEKLMEGIEIYKEESEKMKEHAEECKRRGKNITKPDVHLLMVAYNQTDPEKFVLEVLKKIKSSELEESLLVLPFHYVIDLLKILNIFLTRSWEVELSLRCLLFLFRVNHGQVCMNSSLLPVVDNLRQVAQQRVQEMKDVIGFNLAGLQFMQREVEAREEVTLFSDATENFKRKKRKARKKSRAILTVS